MAQLTESLFDTSLTAPASAQVKERDIKNEVHEIRKIERAGRRAYRQAMRDGDGMRALAAIEKTRDMTGGSTGAGIRVSGQLERSVRQRDASQRGAMRAYSGRGNPTPQQKIPLAAYDQDGNGLSDFIQRPAPGPDTANPNASAGAGYGRPISSRLRGRTANPNATAGAGYGTPLRRGPMSSSLGADNREQRLGLFERMKASVSPLSADPEGDLSIFEEEARGLGIDSAGFRLGATRAIESVVNAPPPQAANPMSQSLMDRISTFSAGPATRALSTPPAGPPLSSTQNPAVDRRILGPFAEVFRSLQLA